MSGVHGPIRVTVWNENVHEQTEADVRARYPSGIHGAVSAAIGEHLGARAEVRVATLDEPEHGLPDDVLAATDVLVWWGHIAHDRVTTDVVDQFQEHVLRGMGLVVLHSGHLSKVFRRLMGTTCTLRWRSASDRELVWTVKPGHPIASGISDPIIIPTQEMYGEPFDIPEPDELVFISSFSGGEVFRSGCVFHRGAGRVFYFSPGDQAYPVYHHPDVQRVIANAVAWAAPQQPSEHRDVPKLRHSETGWYER